MWETNPSENSHHGPMFLLSGRGVGEGYLGDEVASAKDGQTTVPCGGHWQPIYSTYCCSSNFWGYGGQTCVTVPDDDQEEEWEVCVCVCVCVCWLGERRRRVKVQRIPLSPSTALVNPLQPPALPSHSAAAGLTRVQSDGGRGRAHVWRGAISDYTKLRPHKMSQASNLWF